MGRRWATDGTTAALLAALTLVVVLAAPAGAQEPSGVFAQLEGDAGCVVDLAGTLEHSGACRSAPALNAPLALTLTPDGRHLLVGAGEPEAATTAVSVLDRRPRDGSLSHASCSSGDGGDGRLGSDGACSDVDGLGSSGSLTVTPDGRRVYVASFQPAALNWFERDPTTGSLGQRGCLKAFVWPGERCEAAPLLGGAADVAITPDGRTVLVVAARSGALLALRHDEVTGHLRRVSCVSDTGSDGLCENGEGLRQATSVAVTPDGAQVVVTAGAQAAVTTYDLDAAGRLHPRQCFGASVAEDGTCVGVRWLLDARVSVVSPEGTDVYVGGESTITAFRRRPGGALERRTCWVYDEPSPEERVGEDAGEPDDEEWEDPTDDDRADCERAPGLSARALALSADGRVLFAGGEDRLVVFRRDTSTGALSWRGCTESGREHRACALAPETFGVVALAASADGRNLYIADGVDTISVLAASVAVAPAARVDARGRVRVALACPAARPTACRGALRRAGGGPAARFRLAPGRRGAVALPLAAAAARRARAGALRALTLTTSDATHLTTASRHRVALRPPP